MTIIRNADDFRQLEEYRENERRTNIMVSVFSLLFVAMSIVTHILQYFDYSYGVFTINTYMFLPISFMVLILWFVVRHYRYRGSWVKYVLLGAITFMCLAGFFIYTTYMAYMVFIPLIISARYFNRKFTIMVSVASLILFLISCIANIVLDSESELIRILHEDAVYNCWTNPLDAFVYIVAPLAVTYLFLMIYSFSEANNGRGLLRAQAQSAARVATVEAELNMAAEIQRSALPDPSFSTPDGAFRILAEEIPAREVGGDFYDYFMVNSHILAVAIADVSDKGAPAAMFMMSAKKAIRCAVQCCQSLATSIELANRLICQDNQSGMFLTLWLGLIDTRSGEGKYINAGHPSPLVHHRDGTVTVLDNEPDLFLGNFPEFTPTVNLFHLEQGDTLLLYTDGLTDAMNTAGESFGADRLTDTLRTVDTTAEQAVHAVMSATQDFSGAQEQFDDMTLLALQCSRLESATERVFDTSANGSGTKQIIDGVDALLRTLNCPDETRRNMAVVVDELCANISDYAYDGADGPLRVEATGGSNYIILRFIDSGLAFDPLQHSDPVFTEQPIIGGLGIYFVRNLVDDITYLRQEGQNILTLKTLWFM